MAIFDKAEFKSANFDTLFSQKSLRDSVPQISQDSHSQGFETLSISFEGAIEWSAFGIWLSLLLHKYGTQILRVKGIIDIGEDFLVSINGAMHIIHPPTHISKDFSGSKIVFITRNLERTKIIDSLKGFKKMLGMRDFKIV